MLTSGEIPKKEPTISIGIVLPSDKQNSIEISTQNEKKKYSITAADTHLIVNNKHLKNFKLKHSTHNLYFLIHPVPTGRGFHWEKNITIQVPGNLFISNRSNSLFVVNEIKLEMYLMCVAISEMSNACPPALLKAQTIAARSWIVAAAEQKHAALGIDACNDDCCQRYQGIKNLTQASKSSVEMTRGQFLIFNNKICDTRYSKSCGGISENNENVWDEKPKPYLRGIPDSEKIDLPDFNKINDLEHWMKTYPECYCSNKYISNNNLKKYIGVVDKKGDYFRWEFTYSIIELKEMIYKKLGIAFDSILSIKALKRGVSGRIIKLKIEGIKNTKPYKAIIVSEYEIRRVLHNKFLYSSAFITIPNLDTNNNLDSITLKGAGWGHGVGLCQIGALVMALQNKSTKKILSHYFLSTTLKKLYD